MKVKVKLFYNNGIWQKSTLYLSKKKLNELGLFGAVKDKVKEFAPKQILILGK